MVSVPSIGLCLFGLQASRAARVGDVVLDRGGVGERVIGGSGSEDDAPVRIQLNADVAGGAERRSDDSIVDDLLDLPSQVFLRAIADGARWIDGHRDLVLVVDQLEADRGVLGRLQHAVAARRCNGVFERYLASAVQRDRIGHQIDAAFRRQLDTHHAGKADRLIDLHLQIGDEVGDRDVVVRTGKLVRRPRPD